MSVLSKEKIKVLGQCTDIVHQFHPRCETAALISFYWAFKIAIKIYGSLYVVRMNASVSAKKVV